MSTIKDGGPAFPVHSVSWKEKGEDCVAIGTHGMTLRDYFAGQALAGLSAQTAFATEPSETLASWSYQQADAMLAARKEGKK